MPFFPSIKGKRAEGHKRSIQEAKEAKEKAKDLPKEPEQRKRRQQRRSRRMKKRRRASSSTVQPVFIKATKVRSSVPSAGRVR